MKLIRIVFIGICILLAYYVFSRSKESVQKIYPTACKYGFDSLFSKEFKKSIESYIDDAYAQNPDPEKLVKTIAKQFPALQQITFDVCQQEHTKFIIHGYKPLLVINNEFVVLASGKVFPVAWYHKKLLHELCNVSYEQVVKKDKVDKRFVKFVVGCPQEILDECSVIWKSHEDIQLRSKKDTNLVIRTNSSGIPEMQDLEICNNMKEKVGTQRGNKKGKKQTMVCDMRFSRQLVVSSE